MTGRTLQMVFSLQKTEEGEVFKKQIWIFLVISKIDFAPNIFIPYSKEINTFFLIIMGQGIQNGL